MSPFYIIKNFKQVIISYCTKSKTPKIINYGKSSILWFPSSIVEMIRGTNFLWSFQKCTLCVPQAVMSPHPFPKVCFYNKEWHTINILHLNFFQLLFHRESSISVQKEFLCSSLWLYGIPFYTSSMIDWPVLTWHVLMVSSF
jgi:hypothetical protein